MINDHLDQLHVIGKALLEYETLSGDEIKLLLEGGKIHRPSADDPPPTKPSATSSVPTAGSPVRSQDGGTPGNIAPEPQAGS